MVAGSTPAGRASEYLDFYTVLVKNPESAGRIGVFPNPSMRKQNEKNSVFEGEEMRCKKYYLHTRKGIFYAELTDSLTGQKLTAKSTGEYNRDDALLVVSDLLKNGIPSKSGQIRKPIEDTFTIKKILYLIRSIELTHKDAKQIVKSLIDRNLIKGTLTKTNSYESELLSDFIIRLWNWYSPFIREKVAYRNKISRRLLLQKKWLQQAKSSRGRLIS